MYFIRKSSIADIPNFQVFKHIIPTVESCKHTVHVYYWGEGRALSRMLIACSLGIHKYDYISLAYWTLIHQRNFSEEASLTISVCQRKM